MWILCRNSEYLEDYFSSLGDGMKGLLLVGLLGASFSVSAEFPKNGEELFQLFRNVDSCQVETLQSKCDADSYIDTIFLQGYLFGFIDFSYGVACPDKGVASIGEVSLIVRRYIEDNPSERYKDVKSLVLDAMSQKYPCTKG